ncbi:SMC-Scp complex subunit ScpB [Lachnospiraceae bacterium LCP25S3_G4]
MGIKKLEIKRLEGIIEAILFAMGDSVELDKIALAVEHDKETTRKIIHNMMDKYESEERGVHIIELEDSFQMCTKVDMYDFLIKIAKQPKKYTLTDVQLETLSIVAYKQPVTRLEIEKIRGVKSDHAMNRLIEYNLVCEVGRLDAPGRPLLFGTTEEFLRRFGVQSLDDLPSLNPEQVEDFKAEAEDEIQLKLDV